MQQFSQQTLIKLSAIFNRKRIQNGFFGQIADNVRRDMQTEYARKGTCRISINFLKLNVQLHTKYGQDPHAKVVKRVELFDISLFELFVRQG